MAYYFQHLWVVLALLSSTLAAAYMQAPVENDYRLKSAVFFSPKFVLGPGSVENRFYYNIDFPRGHIALKSFDAEVVDEAGNPIPLHETYLHHWVVFRYYQRKDGEARKRKLDEPSHFVVKNDGVCQGNTLRQYFGLGSETRKTATHIPNPYGIEVGNPAEISAGYEEGWGLNVHAIDTRGVEDRLGCTECRCDLYNVTVDEYGRPLRPDYGGGLLCCYDQTQCKVRKGFESVRKALYLKYTVKWIDWDDSILPVKIYIFDVTDTLKMSDTSTGHSVEHNCRVEYEIEPCGSSNTTDGSCVDSKRTSLIMPTGGYVIYGAAHQHTGGVGSTLYGEDGRVICSSLPIYGKGNEAGNETGYIVGMSTCYPEPGSIRLRKGETLVLESNYSSSQGHTGVMGLFYILVADQIPGTFLSLHAPFKVNIPREASTFVWAGAFLGLAVAGGFLIHHLLKGKREDGYQELSM